MLKFFKLPLLLTLAGLILPLVASQVSPSFNWSTMDWILAGLILFSAISAVKAFFTVTSKGVRLVAAILVVLLALLYIEMAVGLFGSPIAGS